MSSTMTLTTKPAAADKRKVLAQMGIRPSTSVPSYAFELWARAEREPAKAVRR
jgi:hypothetical protein